MQELHDLLASGRVRSFKAMDDEAQALFLDALATPTTTATATEDDRLVNMIIEIFFGAEPDAVGIPFDAFDAFHEALTDKIADELIYTDHEILDRLDADDVVAKDFGIFEASKAAVALHPLDLLGVLADPEIIDSWYDVEALAASNPFYADELPYALQEPIWVLRGNPSLEAFNDATSALNDLGWAFAMYHGHERARWCLLPLRRGIGVLMLLI